MGVTIDQESLSRLTLRQLRLKASKLGIPLYSRKSKAELVKGVFLYEEKKELDKQLINVKVQVSTETTHPSSQRPKSFFFLVIPSGHMYFGRYQILIVLMLKMKALIGFVCV